MIPTPCLHPGAVYLEKETTMQASGRISFIGNAAGSSGGALIGSRRSTIDIRSDNVAFVDNTAVTVYSVSSLLPLIADRAHSVEPILFIADRAHSVEPIVAYLKPSLLRVCQPLMRNCFPLLTRRHRFLSKVLFGHTRNAYLSLLRYIYIYMYTYVFIHTNVCMLTYVLVCML